MRANLVNEYNLYETRVSKKDRIEILRDSKYIVVAPLSEEASCKYGAFTNWCTANPHSGAFSLDISDNLNKPNKNKLIYIIQRNYNLTKKNEEQSDLYHQLLRKIEDNDFETELEEEKTLEQFNEIKEDIDSLNFSKIAIEYNKQYNTFNIWTANNINISDGYGYFYYDLDTLPIDKYVIEKIIAFCKDEMITESLRDKLVGPTKEETNKMFKEKYNKALIIYDNITKNAKIEEDKDYIYLVDSDGIIYFEYNKDTEFLLIDITSLWNKIIKTGLTYTEAYYFFKELCTIKYHLHIYLGKISPAYITR